MIPKTFRKYRLLFIKSGCSHCKLYCEFIEKINSKLPIHKRIKIINCDYIRYGITEEPILILLNNYITGFPTLFLDGRLISGINTRIETEAFLNTIIQKDYIVPEHNEFMENDECEYQKKGLFRKKIFCKGV